MSIHYTETKYGFDWGAAKVQRCCSDDKKGWVLLLIETQKAAIQIYVTKTGKLRVTDGLGEWTRNEKGETK